VSRKLHTFGGTATYLSVLDSQRSLFTAELTLAQARSNEYESLVQLCKALGGGWKTEMSLPEQLQQSDRLDPLVWKITSVAVIGSFLSQIDATAVNA
jgi:hypothetical protein